LFGTSLNTGQNKTNANNNVVAGNFGGARAIAA
jgi:hypothetical protein